MGTDYREPKAAIMDKSDSGSLNAPIHQMMWSTGHPARGARLTAAASQQVGEQPGGPGGAIGRHGEVVDGRPTPPRSPPPARPASGSS